MTDETVEEAQTAPEAPENGDVTRQSEAPVDEFASMSEAELAAAMLRAQARTRAIHAEEDAKAAAQLVSVGASIVATLPTPEEVARRAEEARLEAERAREARARRAEELHELRIRRWDESCEERYATYVGATIERLPDGLRQDIAGWLADDDSRTLVLSGKTGSGKTHVAFAAMREYFIDGKRVKFWPIPKLLDALRPSSSASETEAVMHEATTTDLLVLDDLGSERATDWSLERLYIIVNDRWMARRRMIVTSNLARESLLEVVGERMFSRFMDRAYVLSLGSKDRREAKL